MADLRLVKLAAPLDGDHARRFVILIPGDRSLEIAPVRHAVGPDRAASRQFEFLAVIFADETARRSLDQFDPVEQAARNDGDFLRFEIDDAELGAEPQPPFLGHDEKLGVG